MILKKIVNGAERMAWETGGKHCSERSERRDGTRTGAPGGGRGAGDGGATAAAHPTTRTGLPGTLFIVYTVHVQYRYYELYVRVLARHL